MIDIMDVQHNEPYVADAIRIHVSQIIKQLYLNYSVAER